MRVRLPLGRGLFFLCAFLFALVALMPMRAALDWFGLAERGLAAREAGGSVWQGALSEAQMGGMEIGDLRARTRFLPLLVGRARLELEANEDSARFEGALTSSRHGFGVDDLNAVLRPTRRFGPLAIASIDLADVSVGFDGGQCRAAEGRVKATMSGEVAGIALPGLSGNARCDGGALLLPLMSQTGMEGVHLRFYGGGRYRADLIARPAEEGMLNRLVAAGFRPSGDTYVLQIPGEL